MNLSAIFKLLIIALGIYSATMLAWRGFGIVPAFSDLLVRVEQVLGVALAPIEELVVLPTLSWLRTLGISLELQPHWKHSFLLLWLYFSAQASSYHQALYRYSTYLSGAIAALLTGVATGTVPLGHWAVLFCGLAGMNLAAFLGNAILRTLGAQVDFPVSRLAFVILYLTIAILVPMDEQQWPGTPLAILVGFITWLGVRNVFVGAREAFRGQAGWWENFTNTLGFKDGSHVLVVLSGAAILVGLGYFIRAAA